MKIAYLGLGLMGEAMAVNLARAGLNVVGWNRTPGKPGEVALLTAGGKVARSLEDAVSGAGVIFTCLGDIEDVEQVLLKAGGVIECAAPGTVIADFSTIGPEAARRIFASLNSKGMHFLDAPVTGGDVGARNATLTIMVGGDEEPFQKALAYLEKVGKTIKRCGPSGSGQALKLCNQILCAVNMISVCEAFHLAKQLGVDENLVVDVLSAGAGGSWALTNLGPRIIKSDFAPGFALKHMLKDLRLVFENLDGKSDELPGTKLARELFKQVGENGDKAGGGANGARGTQAMSLAYD
ncbi:MAG: NAD(P)-dependent oxidoreductase [Candidatus Melainabacteria bacterium]|nr:NAD(P)-dependent oxidoreductase [Candidatus Melainabacteria bacterium]